MSFSFDPRAVEPAKKRSYEPLPKGNYIVQLIDHDLKENANGSGETLKLTFRISVGQYTNRRVWKRLFIRHTDQAVQVRSQQELSAICAALDYTGKLDDLRKLYNRNIAALIFPIPAKDEYPASTGIGAFRSAVPEDSHWTETWDIDGVPLMVEPQASDSLTKPLRSTGASTT